MEEDEVKNIPHKSMLVLCQKKWNYYLKLRLICSKTTKVLELKISK